MLIETDAEQGGADAETADDTELDDADTGAEHDEAGADDEAGDDSDNDDGQTDGETADETGQSEQRAEADTDKPKKGKWWQSRIDQLTKQKSDSERSATTASERAEAAEARSAALQALLEAQGVDPDQGTQPKTYTQEEVDRVASEKADTLAEQKANAKVWNDRCDALYASGEKTFGPAWETALSNLRRAGVITTTDVSFLSVALEVESPEKVLHHLGRDPEEAQRIAALPPIRQAIELERLAQRVGKPGAMVSNAPAPIKPLDGIARTEPDLADPTLSDEEWMRLRNKTAGPGRRRGLG